MTESEREGYEEANRIGAGIALILFLVASAFLAYAPNRQPTDTGTYTDYRVRKAMEDTKHVPVSAYPEYHRRP